METSGGYLTPDLAIATLNSGGQDEDECFRHHLIDVRTGTHTGEIAVETTDPCDVVPMGDGSWLSGGHKAHPIRWSRARPAPAPPLTGR
jgi:hypothetical protein